MNVKGFKVTLYTNKGQTEEVVKSLKMEVGRNVAADLPIMANGVSRAHLHVVYKDGVIFVTDLASTNGTYIAGSRLQANKPVAYEPGKRISLGQAGCFLRLEMLSDKPENTDSKIKAPSHTSSKVPETVTPPPTNQVSSVVFSEEEKENFKEQTRSMIRNEILAEVTKEAKLEAKKEVQNEIEKDRKKRELAKKKNKEEKTNVGTVTGANKIESQLTQDTGIFNVFANAVSNIAGPGDSDSKAKKKAHKYIQNAEKMVQQRKKEAEAAIRNGLGRARAQAKDIVEQAKAKSLEINDINNKKIEKAQNEAAELKREAQKYVEKIRIENAKLEERLAFLKKDIAEYQENYSAKEDTLKALQKQTDELQSKHDKTLKGLNTVIDNLEKDINDKKRDLERLVKKQEEEVEDHQTKLSNFERKYDEFNRVYKNELEAFEKIKAERSENEEKLKSYHNEFLDLEKQSHAKKTAFKKVEDKLNRAVENYEVEIAEMEANKRKTQAQIESELEDKIRSAQEEASAIMTNAQNESDRMREELYREVETIKTAAKEESESLIKKSREESEEILSRASEKENSIDSIVSTKLEEISEKEQKALAQAQEKLDHASKVLVEEKEKANKEADFIISSAKREKEELLKTAHNEKEELIVSAQAEKEEILSGLKQREKEQIDHFENERARFHAEIKALRLKEKGLLESELAELKVAQLRDIDLEVKKKKSLQNEFKVEQADVWAKGIGISLQSSLVSKFQFVAEDPALIREEIERVSKSILVGEIPEEQEEIRKLMNFDPERIKKVKKYWRNASIGGVIAVIALIMSPYMIRTVKSNVAESAKNKKKASAEYVKNIEEKRKEERQFNPVKVDKYKRTYTDRVLYTRNYVKNELKKSYREDWSLNLDTFFVETLRLSDNAIFAFISKESILIQDLKKARDNINAQRKEDGIQKMRDLELAFEKDVKKLLKTEGKYMMFTDFKKDYYTSHYNLNRIPAKK